MPFKSEAQRKKFRELEAQGKLPPGTTEKWESETPAGKPPPPRAQKRTKSSGTSNWGSPWSGTKKKR